MGLTSGAMGRMLTQISEEREAPKIWKTNNNNNNVNNGTMDPNASCSRIKFNPNFSRNKEGKMLT